MASKYIQKYGVPEGFSEILHDFAREVLRDQPKDIIQFGFEYFKAKDDGLDFDYKEKGKNIPPVASKREEMKKDETNAKKPKQVIKKEHIEKKEDHTELKNESIKQGLKDNKESKNVTEIKEKQEMNIEKTKEIKGDNKQLTKENETTKEKNKNKQENESLGKAKEESKEAKKHEEITKISKEKEETKESRDNKKTTKVTKEEAHRYHQYPIPGKYQIVPCKPLDNEKDLRLAYSPGVGFPCQEILKNPLRVYDYTSKANSVCVISNGTAVLGLGNIGALSGKPVMEGKGVLMKKFGDINGVDLEVNTTNPDEFINCVKLLGSSFGGINLEDIKGPDCFYIENKLKEIMNIPVFHDDQHGTAIIVAAGLVNACRITKRQIDKIKVVFNGAGAAGIACLQLAIDSGVDKNNAILCDTSGVIYKGRTKGMNEWKEKYMVETEARTLEEALVGADVFVGVSAKDALKPEWLKKMNPQPIVFALANPDPEILPEVAKVAVPDVIIATGRSDYPNQINNVMCFPYLFRGTLDVRAKNITEGMKLATSKALAELAREEVPTEIKELYGRDLSFGPEYIIPTPFDPRLLVKISTAVAKAACKEPGNCSFCYSDWQLYEKHLNERVGRKNEQINAISSSQYQ